MASTISEFGDWSARLTLAALLFARTDDPAWVGMVSVAFIIPRLGVGQLLTGWSERWTRKPLLVGGDSLRAAVFVVASLVELSPIPLLGLVLVAATIDPVFEANASAASFDLLTDDDRDDGVRLRQVTKLIAQVGGLGLTGVALRWMSPQSLLLANAATFALSAVIIATSSVIRPHQPPASVGRTLLDAAATIARNLHIRAALVTTTITIFAATAAEVQVVVFADGQPSWVLPAASAAAPLMAAIAISFASTAGGTRPLLHKALLVTTVSTLAAMLAFEVERPWAYVAAYGAVGAMFQTVIVGQVIAVRHLPEQGRASILSLLQTVVLVGSAAGAAASGFLMNLFGNRRGIQLCLAVAFLAWLIPVPRPESEPNPDVKKVMT